VGQLPAVNRFDKYALNGTVIIPFQLERINFNWEESFVPNDGLFAARG
jgi:hypothetical protein